MEATIRSWFDFEKEKEKPPKAPPQTAQELTERFNIGQLETSASRLASKRESKGVNLSILNEMERESWRQEAVVFLTKYLQAKNSPLFDEKKFQSLLVFAKEIIMETAELEARYPTLGLEEFFPNRDNESNGDKIAA